MVLRSAWAGVIPVETGDWSTTDSIMRGTSGGSTAVGRGGGRGQGSRGSIPTSGQRARAPSLTRA